MKIIPLTKGYVAIVDDEDFATLATHKWCVSVVATGNRTLFYAVRRQKGSSKLTLMHRVITHAPEGMEVDHKDGNGLNNVKKNLRMCTRAQNCYHSSPRKIINRASTYKGVSFRSRKQSRHKPWVAQLVLNGKHALYKEYATEHEAAQAYNQAAKKHYGKFAWLNKDV